MMEKKMKLGNLFDFYGELLTDKQKDILRLFCIDDFSLGEIAEEYNITRQAVFDTIKRVEIVLDKYEEKLGLYNKFKKNQVVIKEINFQIIELRNNEIIKNDNFLSKHLEELIKLSSTILD